MMIAAKAMRDSRNPFDREAVNAVLLSKNFSYDGVGGKYVFDPKTHMAKYGPGLIEFATKQEWDGKSTVLVPASFKNGDFHLPPWYKAGMEKYGQ
jgi:ABC-type branched-subunit amino acid transport system substrate-binding protein